LDYSVPFEYKVCKKETISKLMEGYTADISQGGVLCNIKDKVKKGDILWLSFDRSTLTICSEIDKRSLIYQNGIIGKVVRIDDSKDGHKDKGYEVGVQFITREEKNMTNIFPKVHFLEQTEINE